MQRELVVFTLFFAWSLTEVCRWVGKGDPAADQHVINGSNVATRCLCMECLLPHAFLWYCISPHPSLILSPPSLSCTPPPLLPLPHPPSPPQVPLLTPRLPLVLYHPSPLPHCPLPLPPHRYPYYAAGALNLDVKLLTWLRYTVWIAMYPLGGVSEGTVNTFISSA